MKTILLFVFSIGFIFSNPIEIENLLSANILGKWQIHDKTGKSKVVIISNDSINIYNSSRESSGYIAGNLSRVIKSDKKEGIFNVKFLSIIPNSETKQKIKKANKYEEWKYKVFNSKLILLERTNAIDVAKEKSFHDIMILRKLK